MFYIGLMSGTSMDAVDTALVNFDKKTTLECYREYPINKTLKQKIRQLNETSSLDLVSKCDYEIGKLFADSVNKLLDEAGVDCEQILAIGSHGQTILHRPDGFCPGSIQIGDPNIICYETGITTIADFRRMDIAAGGQGAPLASAFHEYQFKQKNKTTVILNIGGIANITVMDESGIRGFDTGPGNGLMDDWIQFNKNEEFDKDSSWAEHGGIDNELFELMLGDDYFKLSSPKSTGREYFNLGWIEQHLKELNREIPPENIQCTLLNLSVISISNAINDIANNIDEILVCGGGAKNKLLMKMLKELVTCSDISTTDKYGLSPDCIEAVTFAWLAKQRLEEKTINLSAVTGAKQNVLLGGIYSSKKKT